MAHQYSLFPEKKKDKEILIVDLETTGFLKQKGVIVEIGIVKLNLNNGEITTMFDSVVREPSFNAAHTRPPFGWIFQNSTLRYEDVEKAPPLSNVFSEVQDIFNQYEVTAYNAAFDLPFLKSRSFTLKSLPCPMIAATPVLNLPPAYGKNEPKWPSVEEAWNYFFPGSTTYHSQHRALDDARHEAKIVHELHKHGHYSV